MSQEHITHVPAMPKRKMPNKPRTIGFQLLLVVNAVMTVLVVVLLAFDYQLELNRRISDGRVALAEEAKTILPAVIHLGHHGQDAVQEFLDTVCGQMQDEDSPGHHIAVQFGDVVLQAHSHDRASGERFAAMRAAMQLPGHRTLFSGDELVVGTFTNGEISVYVSESVSHLRRSSLGDLLRRLTGIVILGVLAAALVNLVLLRVVVRPMRRLVSVVHGIADGQLGIQASPEHFGSAELSYLAEAINGMSSSLAESDQRRTLQLAKARRIQQNLLPRMDETPGMEVICFHEPAEDIAGDYYDILRLPDGALLVCIADVSGHGVPAAMAAAILKALLTEATTHLEAPGEIMRFVNQSFASLTLPEDFATMALAKYQPESGQLDYVNAGHESSWILDEQGRLQELPSGGLLIGIDPEATWDTRRVIVGSHGRLLLTTDGVNELCNPWSEMFGRQRLVQLFRDAWQRPLDEAASGMYETIEEFRDGQSPHDDLTLLVVELGVTSFEQSAPLKKSDARSMAIRTTPHSHDRDASAPTGQ